MIIFFFKQKTAYEMRISDWSSDVCSSDLLHPNIDSAFGLAQDCSDLVRRVVHSIEIVTEDFDRDVTAHPGDQFVEAHLDRLGYLKRAARNAFEDCLHLCHEISLGQALVGPLAFRLHDDERQDRKSTRVKPSN